MFYMIYSSLKVFAEEFEEVLFSKSTSSVYPHYFFVFITFYFASGFPWN